MSDFRLLPFHRKGMPHALHITLGFCDELTLNPTKIMQSLSSEADVRRELVLLNAKPLLKLSGSTSCVEHKHINLHPVAIPLCTYSMTYICQIGFSSKRQLLVVRDVCWVARLASGVQSVRIHRHGNSVASSSCKGQMPSELLDIWYHLMPPQGHKRTQGAGPRLGFMLPGFEGAQV